MRMRFTLVGIAAALLVTFLAASPAGASESVGSCVAEEFEVQGVEHVEEVLVAGLADGASDEAVAELEELEEDLEACLEAPSPIIPELNEIIWGGLAFLVLLAFMLWKGFPAVKNIMNARSEKIANELDEADKTLVDAREVKTEYESELAEAKTEAAQIIEDARQQAGVVRADLQARAEADIAEMRTQANIDVEAARARALADLKAEVSDIIVGAAERVIEANLDHEAQVTLIENYINQVGSR